MILGSESSRRAEGTGRALKGFLRCPLRAKPRSVPAGNSLLLNSSLQPELTVSRTYSGPICLQDPLDKELMTESSLFNPLADIKVKVQSSFMVSLGVTDRAEFHGKAHPGTFPHGTARTFGSIQARNKAMFIQNLASISSSSELRSTALFGHLGGRLVVPNTGGWIKST